MLHQELNRKVVLIVAAATLALVVVGFVGYNSYQKKEVNTLVARRDWQVNREMGIPLSMEADTNASPEEREQARKAALEQLQWGGKSEVDTSAVSPTQ
jgi:hypothetical protein